MSLFQWKEHRRYRRMAKGRHGVHSPFVYRFIKEALRPPIIAFSWNLLPYVNAEGGLGVWYCNDVMRRVLRYFDFSRIAIIYAPYVGIDQEMVMRKEVSLEPENVAFQRATQGFETLYDFNAIGLHVVTPEDWLKQFKAIISGISELDVIALHNIHQSPVHIQAWEALCVQQEVRMSIDLFESGLLFFNKDFKERQHFVLKYPA